jgi:hypothetical protein
MPGLPGKKLKRQRLLVTLGGRTIHELGELSLVELRALLDKVPLPPSSSRPASRSSARSRPASTCCSVSAWTT